MLHSVSPPVAVSKPFDKIEVEFAVNDVEGDVLLLNLAIADVFTDRVDAGPDGFKVYRLTEDQAKAIMHATSRAWASMKALNKAFYGEEEEPG